MLRKHICLIATIPFALKVFMGPHIKKLSTMYDVTLMANGKEEDLKEFLNDNVKFICVPIERHISIPRDLKALFVLFSLFTKYRFSAVHSFTPKAGLLAMTAARIALIPIRIHTYTGQVWATANGRFRKLLMMMDKVMAFNATKVFSDSPSQSKFLIENHIVEKAQISELGDGSFSGVNTERFKPNFKVRNEIRKKIGVSEETVLFLYMGRLHIEKGLGDLFRAFSMTAFKNEKVELLIVGPSEGEFDFAFKCLELSFPGRVHRVGYTTRPEDYIATADVFCLPSYREGFGSVLIEAAATEVPSIASRIYGISDAVDDGVTGILHQVRSVNEMSNAMNLLVENKELRLKMGKKARERAITKFSEERITNELLSFYREKIS